MQKRIIGFDEVFLDKEIAFSRRGKEKIKIDIVFVRIVIVGLILKIKIFIGDQIFFQFRPFFEFVFR